MADTVTARKLPQSNMTDTVTARKLPQSNMADTVTARKLPQSNMADTVTARKLPQSNMADTVTARKLPQSNMADTVTARKLPQSNMADTVTARKLPQSNMTDTVTARKLPQSNMADTVFCSVRPAGPVRLSNTKKRNTGRKTSTTSVDSGYSLYSTDSEDQVLVINKGLNRCAALLQDILQNDVKAENTEQNVTHRPAVPRGNVRQLTTKGKKAVSRKIASHVHNEIGVTLRNPGPCGVRDKEVKTLRANTQPRLVSPHSPVAQPALFEHVQTQMSVLKQGPEYAPLYNCRLPSSTPALSPQNPGNPQNACHEGYSQVLPLGGAHFPSSMVTHSANPAIPPIVYMPTPGQHNPAAPIPQMDTLSKFITNDSQIKDVDFLQCVANHLAQYQGSEANVQTLQKAVYSTDPGFERDVPTREIDEASSGDDEMHALSKDISCQTSFDKNLMPKRTSPEKKIKTVKYLLGEIKALVANQGHGEAMHLMNELEHNVSLLPGVLGRTNVQAEIALALQPLRSENAQLRRRLRILNQQLRERSEKALISDTCNSEMVSVQSKNATLQHQLTETQKGLSSLQSKNEELLKLIDAQKDENNKLVQIVQEKEQELLRIQQQTEISASRTQVEVDEALGKTRSLQFKLESTEKEYKILEITLQQRDEEVSRLKDLTRTLQGGMAKLLCDLREDSSKLKSGPSLTKSLLDSYEKQLQVDNCPASTSVISYLKQLETDQVFPSRNPCFPAIPVLNVTSKDFTECLNSDVSKVRAATDVSHQNTHLRPSSMHSPGKHSSEVRDGSCTSTCDEYKPDETTYLPLTSSPTKAQLTLSQRQMCTPPMVNSLSRDYAKPCSFRTPEDTQITLKNTSQTSTVTLDQSMKSREEIPSTKSKTCTQYRSDPPSEKWPLVLHQIKNLQVSELNLTDRSMLDLMSGKCDWTMTSFSTFTSHDEQDFRNGLAALDANIAKLQRTLQASMLQK
ncbi:Hypothetical predicted protein [Pelobates cultripes]|uniref:Coiled-coil domain-containing protein 14 n=1 Tax=Pelobates cultripes TaxID=61616 RepID=A0AAD1WDG8_PELCU|nr:Hypothetical predicted protein [Pelobates cultripes]